MDLHFSFDRKSLVVQQGKTMNYFRTDRIDSVGPTVFKDGDGTNYAVRIAINGHLTYLETESEVEMDQVCRLIWSTIHGEHTVPALPTPHTMQVEELIAP